MSLPDPGNEPSTIDTGRRRRKSGMCIDLGTFAAVEGTRPECVYGAVYGDSGRLCNSTEHCVRKRERNVQFGTASRGKRRDGSTTAITSIERSQEAYSVDHRGSG
jgi:hypothetical protein